MWASTLKSFPSEGNPQLSSVLEKIDSTSTDIGTDAATNLHTQSDSSVRSASTGTRSGSVCVDVTPWMLRFEDLVLDKEIGTGSFGKVFMARFHETEVAVKVLIRSGSAGEETEVLPLSHPAHTKLQKEAAIMAAMRHPCIVNFMGVCISPPAIVTEYCARGSLYDCLRKVDTSQEEARQMTWPRRLRMSLDAAKGMLYLHMHNPPILHRDLKSPNLLVGEHWEVKVCDFNLSRIVEDSADASDVGATNPRWLAPETLAGGGHSFASDVFAFGIVLWEMLTFKVPWANITDKWQIARSVIDGYRLPIPGEKELQDKGGTFPGLSAYVDLLSACWTQDPQQRPCFAEVIVQLRHLGEEIETEDPPLPNKAVASILLDPEMLTELEDDEDADKAPPAEFLCPISQEIMVDPVTLPSGLTYDRHCIEIWLDQHSICPVTGTKLPSSVTLVPNTVLKGMIRTWAAEQAPLMLGDKGLLRTPLLERASLTNSSADNEGIVPWWQLPAPMDQGLADTNASDGPGDDANGEEKKLLDDADAHEHKHETARPGLLGWHKVLIVLAVLLLLAGVGGGVGIFLANKGKDDSTASPANGSAPSGNGTLAPSQGMPISPFPPPPTQPSPTLPSGPPALDTHTLSPNPSPLPSPSPVAPTSPRPLSPSPSPPPLAAKSPRPLSPSPSPSPSPADSCVGKKCAPPSVCQSGSCRDGRCRFTNVPAGESCSTKHGAGVCDGQGECELVPAAAASKCDAAKCKNPPPPCKSTTGCSYNATTKVCSYTRKSAKNSACKINGVPGICNGEGKCTTKSTSPKPPPQLDTTEITTPPGSPGTSPNSPKSPPGPSMAPEPTGPPSTPTSPSSSLPSPGPTSPNLDQGTTLPPPPACNPADCPAPTCQTARCDASNQCTTEPAPAGSQCTAADGSAGTCNGAGSCTAAPPRAPPTPPPPPPCNPTDCPAPTCQMAICDATNQCATQSAPAGAQCTAADGSAGTCNGAGSCTPAPQCDVRECTSPPSCKAASGCNPIDRTCSYLNNAASGTPCDANGVPGTCDGNGNCAAFPPPSPDPPSPVPPPAPDNNGCTLTWQPPGTPCRLPSMEGVCSESSLCVCSEISLC